MGPIQVVVQDGNNLVLEVTPTPNTTVILDRGIAGPPGPAGSGDVTGPASSIDNALARFDGTTGKLIQNSVGILSDAGALTGLTAVDTTNLDATNINALDGTASFAIANTTGVMSINDTKFTLQDNADTTKKAQFELSGITTATTRTYTLPNSNTTLAGLAATQTFDGVNTFSGSVTMTSGTGTYNIGTSSTTGVTTIGGTAGTGILTLGRSTASQTTNIQAGATASGSTKTINFGTGGLSGSITSITIGSAAGTSTTTINGNLVTNGDVTFSGVATNINIGTQQTSGTTVIGGPTQTGTITIGQSTANQTTNIQAGATDAGNNKIINLGTGGLSGSFTSINIGSAAGTSTTTVNGNFAANLANSTGLPLTTGVTGTLPLGNGGTGQTTAAAAITALTGTQVSGQYLRSNGTNAVLSAIQAADVPTLNQNTTGTAANVTGIVAVANGGTGRATLTNNALLVGNAAGNVAFIAPSTAGNVLTSNGTVWQSIAPTAQVYPGAGIAVSTGTAWGTSKTTPTGDVVGTTDTQTLTNKRVTPRSVDIASSATITPPSDTADQYEITALATAATIAAPSGTPTDGQKLVLRFKDDGTARGLTWTTTSGAYRAIGVTLPTTTVLSKVLYVGCVWNAQDSFWDVIALAQQA